jgi:glycine cleavage system regulatory protein
MNIPLVLTIIADDQPGIIKTVSEVLYEFGGSWTESSMASLAGQFAGILLASVPDARADACVEALQALQEKDLHVIAHLSRKTVVASADNREFVLDLVGNNRRGIVHDITAILARHNINVHNLETVAESVAMGGGELFKAKAKLVVPASVDIEVLESELEAMANELMVDIRLQH